MLFVWLFPLGLFWLLDSLVDSHRLGFLLPAVSLLSLFICVAVYPFMFVVFCRLRTTRAFLMACLILALILFLNVRGCQTMLQNPAFHGPE